ncbi:IS110 family transposase [Flavihumibacter sp. R14]|nr:IS110 family transposase [Flavihumibacter soli]
MKNVIIGIDISSRTLDICIHNYPAIEHQVIENDIKAIRSFFRKYAKDDLVVAMENTGRYNWNLFEVLPSFNFKVYVISPLHLKKSLGLIRGKNDQIDASRICSFIERNQADISPWKPTPVEIKKLKVLLTERNSRIKMQRQLLRQQQDYKLMKSISFQKELSKLNKKLLETVDLQVKNVEAQIEKTIQADESLTDQARLIRSVPGVGKVVSWMMIAKTEGFTMINNPRKMACYCGVVPFDHQSGTSIRQRPRVSIYADKTMKSTLHLAAMSAIRLDNDLRMYYRRKIEEGKNKMSVLNAVRNKIIHRIFAVIKNQTLYKTDLALS